MESQVSIIGINVNIISIALDAPTDIIHTLADKIGSPDGISSKVVCSGK